MSGIGGYGRNDSLWVTIMIAAILLPRALFIIAEAILSLFFKKEEELIRLNLNVP